MQGKTIISMIIQEFPLNCLGGAFLRSWLVGLRPPALYFSTKYPAQTIKRELLSQ